MEVRARHKRRHPRLAMGLVVAVRVLSREGTGFICDLLEYDREAYLISGVNYGFSSDRAYVKVGRVYFVRVYRIDRARDVVEVNFESSIAPPRLESVLADYINWKFLQLFSEDLAALTYRDPKQIGVMLAFLYYNRFGNFHQAMLELAWVPEKAMFQHPTFMEIIDRLSRICS